MNNFPHLNDTAFPNLPDAVFSYENNFDYTRWDSNCEIKLFNENFDTNNVCYFESLALRDNYFDNAQATSITLESEMQVLPDHQVFLPIPFDVMSTYNYIMVTFPIRTSAEKPLEYETDNGIRRFFYFVRDITYKAPNTTACYVDLDYWMTFINYCHINYMMLERGHAPVSVTNVDTYLTNPLQNTQYLTAPDVNFGSAVQQKSSTELVLNDSDMYAFIATTANVEGDFGTKADNDWNTPARSSYTVQGAPSNNVFCVLASNLNTLLANIDSQVPQFKATIKGVFFIAAKLFDRGSEFTFADVTCYHVGATQKNIPIVTLNKESFAYDETYADLAKLYTFPYAQLELVDSDGVTTVINVEDTQGQLALETVVSVAYPMVGIDSYIAGIGGNKDTSLTFANINERTYHANALWYKTLKSWNVPIYSIVQSNAKTTDYSTHYNRVQAKVSYDNAYDSAVASANTGKANADASADVNVTNTANNGTMQTNNTALDVAASTAAVARTNSASATITSYNNDLMQSLQAWDSGLQRAVQEAEAQSVAATTFTSALSSIASGAMSGGAIGAAGGVLSAVGGGISAGIMLNAASTKVEASISNAQSKVNEQRSNNTNVVTESTDAQTDNNTTMSNAATSKTANSVKTANTNATNAANTSKNNATRSKNTSIANADRSKDTAQKSVSNSIKQAAIAPPNEYGANTANANDVVKPMFVSVNVVTQNVGAIKQAADYFKRYGYALNQQWQFTTFNVMKNFSYWKVNELWLTTDLGVVQGARDAIIAMLEEGLTVWKSPAQIGKVSIYDN